MSGKACPSCERGDCDRCRGGACICCDLVPSDEIEIGDFEEEYR